MKLRIAALFLGFFSSLMTPLRAQFLLTTGDYNNTANWAGSLVNGQFSGDYTSGFDVTIAGDTTVTTGLNFQHTGTSLGATALIRADGSGNRTFTFDGGNISLATAGGFFTAGLGNGLTGRQVLARFIGTTTIAAPTNTVFSLQNGAVITGTGAVTKTGAGRIDAFGNVEVQSGGSLAINAGTLQANAGVSGNISVASGASIAFGHTGTLTYSDVISGAGNISVTGGGTVVFNSTSAGSGHTGATTIVTGGTVRIAATNAQVSGSVVNVNSGGTFDIQADATVAGLAGAGSVTLGGGYTLTDNASASTTFSGVISGAGALTKAGTGTLSLTGASTYGGTTRITSGTLQVSGSGGSITQGAADLMIAPDAAQVAALNIQAGASVTSNYGRLGLASDATGSATVSGTNSIWTNNTYLYVGEAGTGTLNVSNGGTVNAANVSIGNNPGGTGMVTVDGTGSSLNQTDTGTDNGLFVGSEGTGTLFVQNGGLVTSVTGSVGNNEGGTGSAIITGAGSEWRNSGSLFVGGDGTGILSILSGGKVTSTDATIGNIAGSSGSALVTGQDSTWANSGNLFVGAAGDGTLTINDHAMVTSLNTTIGNNTGGTGQLYVNLGGSLTDTGALRVGYEGAGILSVQNGGIVTSDTAIIGSATGGTGQALISGPNSSWTNAGGFFLGDYTQGSLTLAGTATLTLGTGAGTLTLGSHGGTGVLNIGNDSVSPAAAGGYLNAGVISTSGGGTGTVQFNTTGTSASPYYFTRSGSAESTPVVIIGPTNVTFNAGYNVFAATNSYTGSTIINGGTAVALYQGGQYQFGYGPVTINSGGTLTLQNATLANSSVSVESGGRLNGYGSLGNGYTGYATTVKSNGVVAPGIAGSLPIGTLSFDHLTLQSGAIYEWNLQNPTGMAGSDWDLIAITTYAATLHIDSTTGSKLTLKAISLDDEGDPGTATGFANHSYSWKIFDGGDVPIQYGSGSFDPALFNIDGSAFVTNLGGGSFSLSEDAETYSIYLNFTPVPEPSTYALVALGLGATGLATWRRRRV